MPVRHICGRFSSIPVVPTLTGQWTLAVFSPAACAACHKVGTRMSLAYQYQPCWFFASGSKVWLFETPCSAGATPVTKVVWLGYVSVGRTPVTPLA